MNEELTKETTTLWEDWKNCQAYHASIGLSSNLPKYIDFYEGKQWPAATENTKNLPRPVVNIIKMICRNKKSAILSTPVKIIYEAEEEIADIDQFNHFADYIQREMGHEALDKKAIHDGVIKGPYIYHYYWDAEARGKDGLHEGAMRGEIIDALNTGFSNPEERDEQKQKWIIIRSREDVSSVRSKCDKGVDPNLITADESDDPYGTAEQEGDRLCTVLTRYFRKNGEVYYEKATMNVVINQARPLAPDIEAAKRELGLEPDAPNNSLPDHTEEASMIPKRTRAPLYPVVVGSYEPREKSIYGIGEVEGLIPNQKAVNFTLAMLLLNAQEIAWGKYVVLPNALQGQTITNIPGQVLVDHSKTGQGIRKMTEQVMQTLPLQLVDTLTQLTRSVTGSGEVMTGETISSGMSGAAIAQLQSQAMLPVEELKESFWLVKEKQGKILAQFFKLFYHGTHFRYKATVPLMDENGEYQLMPSGMPKEHDAWVAGNFEGSEYETIDFEVVVEATSGTKASAAGDINVLDTLFAAGKISLKTYLNAYPKDALSNKTDLLREIEKEEQGALAQMQQSIANLQQQAEKYAEICEAQKETVKAVESVIKENESLRGMIAQLYTEGKEKIALANRIISAEKAALRETTSDAREFAGELMQRKLSDLQQNAESIPPMGEGKHPHAGIAQKSNYAGDSEKIQGET